ncbi:hypothetical protein HQ560_15100, partial [bacterium]|nr:hypothetical protein [bacterium]
PEREPSPAEESKPRQQAEEAPTAVPGLIKGGDDLAARARKMKRKKRKGER